MAVSASKIAEFNMAAIIKLSQNEWVKFFFCKMAVSKMAKLSDWQFSLMAAISQS